MNVPMEFTIVSMELLIVQIHLALTSAPAGLVTVETAKIIAFQTASISCISLRKIKAHIYDVIEISHSSILFGLTTLLQTLFEYYNISATYGLPIALIALI